MCVYRVGDEPRYGSGVWATSIPEAQALIEQRNVPGETLEDAMPVASCFHQPAHIHVEEALLDMKSRKKFNSGLHALTFLSYLASCAGTATHEHILGDGGILHEFIHVMTGSANMIRCPFEHVMISVINLELVVPGYLSKAQREDASRYKTTLQERIACSP